MTRNLYNRLQQRIRMLANSGQDICEEYQNDNSSSYNSVTCARCRYTADLHLLRDSLQVLTLLESIEK